MRMNRWQEKSPQEHKCNSAEDSRRSQDLAIKTVSDGITTPEFSFVATEMVAIQLSLQ